MHKELEFFDWTVSVRVWSHSVLREAVKAFEAQRPILTTLFHPRTLEPVRPHRKFVFPEHADQAELLRLLRARFSEHDQQLLLLRWGRRFPWREVAVVLGGPHAATGAIDLEGERLRAHFRGVKARAAIFREDLRRRPS